MSGDNFHCLFVEATPMFQGEETLANTVKGNNDGLVFKIFLAATVINFSGASFIGFTLPFSAKKDQKKDDKDPAPLHQRGVE